MYLFNARIVEMRIEIRSVHSISHWSDPLYCKQSAWNRTPLSDFAQHISYLDLHPRHVSSTEV